MFFDWYKSKDTPGGGQNVDQNGVFLLRFFTLFSRFFHQVPPGAVPPAPPIQCSAAGRYKSNPIRINIIVSKREVWLVPPSCRPLFGAKYFKEIEKTTKNGAKKTHFWSTFWPHAGVSFDLYQSKNMFFHTVFDAIPFLEWWKTQSKNVVSCKILLIFWTRFDHHPVCLLTCTAKNIPESLLVEPSKQLYAR